MRRLGTFLVALFLVQATVATAASAPGLEMDKRFGRDGVVRLDPHVPGKGESFPEDMAGTGSGGFFVLEGTSTGSYLVRYGRTGARDRAFGFVPVFQRSDSYAEASLAVDAEGRPLLYWKEGNDAVIARFTRRGRVDRTFADRGRFVLHCGCYPNWLVLLPKGKILFVAEGNDRVQRRYKGSIPVMVRLRRDGELDRSFGVNGIAHPRLHGRFSPHDFVVEPGGGIVFSGDTCCGLGPGPYAARLRADGKLDRRFGRAARRAVERLPRGAEVLFGHGLVGHRDGTVDLYGDLDFGSRTFVLRLKRNGSLDRSFGSAGMKALRWGLGTVSSDGRNGAIALVYKGREFAYRFGPDVRTGRAPRVPFSSGDSEGVWIEPQRGGTVLIFDLGLDSGCRQTCGTWIQVARLRLTG